MKKTVRRKDETETPKVGKLYDAQHNTSCTGQMKAPGADASACTCTFHQHAHVSDATCVHAYTCNIHIDMYHRN